MEREIPAYLQEYHYFRPERFREGLNLSQELVEQAQKLIDDGNMRELYVTIGYGAAMQGSDRLSGVAYTGLREGKCDVRISFDRTRIMQPYCSHWRCKPTSDRSSYLGFSLCVHEVAAILLLEDYLRRSNPGDATNTAGMALMKELDAANGQVGAAQEIKAEQLTITPTLEIDANNKLQASFRIGAGKSCKIKSLPEFVDRMRRGQTMQIGRSTEVKLSREFLAPTSLPWLDFIKHAVYEERSRQEMLPVRKNRFGTAEEEFRMTGGIPLYGALLDQFIAILCPEPDEDKEGQGEQSEIQSSLIPLPNFASSMLEVVRKDTGEKKSMAVKDSDLQLNLDLVRDVDPENGEFQGVTLTGSVPDTISGQKYCYYMDSHLIHRVSVAHRAKVEPLLQAAVGGEIHVKIGRIYLADFYHRVLPELRQVVEIREHEQEEILPYLPPEPIFMCRLDLKDGTVLAYPIVHYGEAKYSMTDVLDAEEGLISLEPYRDAAAELRILNVVRRYVDDYNRADSMLRMTRSDERMFALLDEGIDEILRVCRVEATEEFRKLGIRQHIHFDVGVQMDANLMDLSITSSDLTQRELLEILRQYRQKKRFVRLKNGEFLRLEQNEAVEQLTAMMDAMHLTPKEFAAGKMQVPAYRALYLERMLEQTQDIYGDRDRRFKSLIKEFKAVEDADYELPASLKNIMRRYQRSGYNWLRTLDSYGFGGILADEMGLGKTLQVISVLLGSYEEENDSTWQSLVVCPASLVYNWREELHRFAPQLKVELIAGTAKDRAELIRTTDANVLVTSYDLLRRDIAEYEGKKFRFEVIDEAQYIKNYTTGAAKSVKLIDARTRFALTGTPIENRLAELWSIFDYLMPGFLYDYSVFKKEIEMPVMKQQATEVSERLRRMVTPFILRRLKKDVLKDLPEKLEEVRYAGMDKKQRRLYDAQVVHMRGMVDGQDEEGFRRSKIEILAELMRIRQICCDPSLCFEDYDGESAKREAAMDMIRSLQEGGHKTLVFSQFTSMLSLLEADLQAEGIPYYKLIGATPKAERLELVNAFNKDATPVFLISLKAGGTGLNLTGADCVIHYDPWWNLAVQNQATDRAHRIGQQKIVTVYRLIMKDTIEEKILAMQENKKKLAEDILSGENISSASITREELLELLR